MESINPHIAFEHWHSQRLKNKTCWNEENPFEMNEDEFRGYFRFTPALAIKLIDELETVARTKAANNGTISNESDEKKIPFEIKCLVAMNFYATGSYQNQIRGIGYMSQSSVSKCIHEITDHLNDLMHKYIVFPMSEVERKRISDVFGKKGMPGIIGIIDGTQIALTALNKNVEMAYMNRKGFHSINAQIIVDDRNFITNINARYPGSVHDSYLWGASLVYAMFQNEYTSPAEQKYWLLGDEGYPLSPFLITVRDEGTDAKHKEFYRRHKLIRSHVERAIGIIKNRFRCILGEKKLHYAPIKCAKIINAVAVCHNFLILHGYEDTEESSSNMEPIIQNNVSERGSNPYLQAGREVRNTIINNLVL